jgi:Peptidase M50B-like
VRAEVVLTPVVLTPVALTPAERKAVDTIRAELSRAVRYDDESIVHALWVRQRYDCGCYPTYEPARKAAVRTAWHEAGHAVAALTVGARFSSASIHHGHRSEGRVHRVAEAGAQAFVIDAAGQLAERLMTWTMLEQDTDLRAWLRTWQADGGDARRFRQSTAAGFGADEVAAWRHCEQVLTPRRLQIRQLARALLVYPRHLPYNVAAVLAA